MDTRDSFAAAADWRGMMFAAGDGLGGRRVARVRPSFRLSLIAGLHFLNTIGARRDAGRADIMPALNEITREAGAGIAATAGRALLMLTPYLNLRKVSHHAADVVAD